MLSDARDYNLYPLGLHVAPQIAWSRLNLSTEAFAVNTTYGFMNSVEKHPDKTAVIIGDCKLS
jgi:hypothetical protein